jgi:bromodomain-containing factor 1
MASDIAPPQQDHLSHSDNLDTGSQDAPYDVPMTNGYVLSDFIYPFHQQGRSFFTFLERVSLLPHAVSVISANSFHRDHIPTIDSMEQEETVIHDAPAFSQPAAVTETAIDTKVAAPLQAGLNPAGPTPVDDVASGIQPVSDFIPKDASNLSHPTPPPDEPLGTGEADVDMGMSAADVSEPATVPSPPPVTTEPASAPSLPESESSLVRAREDDEDEEPAPKRIRIDGDDEPVDLDAPAVLSADISMIDQPTDETADQVEALISETMATPSGMDASTLVVEPVVEDTTAVQPTEDSVVEPSSMVVEASTTQVDTGEATPAELQSETDPEPKAELPAEATPQASAEADTQPDAEHSHTTVQVMDVSEPAGAITASPIEDTPAAPAPATETQLTGEASQEEAKPKYSVAPMTSLQKRALVDKMKNLKKTKSSVAFIRPVDPVAMNIPHYPQVVKNPMDLSTMETKLKQDEYGSVQDFVNDFELIINNAILFNGREHAVTVAGFNMQAYFNKMMEFVPSADEVEQPKVQKKRSPSISREKPPRRESRAVAAPPPAAAPAAPATSAETYALQSDGMPQIRRQSSNRPPRAIKPPQNREISYAKPQRKAHKLELQFCEHVLDEIRSPKYGQFNHVFLHPVDPVALNIPHYRQVIKAPMDLGTMNQKLKSGQYGTASEFKKDFDLVIRNCLAFNPAGNPVRDLGIQLQRSFEGLWAEKDKWERKNQPSSNRASSASAEEDSDAEEEEEEDDDENDDKAKIRALQKQLAEMQNALSGLGADKAVKTKKTKSGKTSTKKAGSMSAAPKAKAPPKPPAKPKKAKQVSYDEKQEISEAVGRMDAKQVERLTEIITTNCAKYRDMEEMELEIDDLPNDVQVMLLDYVRKIFGNPNRKKAREPSPDDAAALDDDDFEPERGARAGKRKKHRPMGKKEQQDAIKNLQSKLAQFKDAATSGSESPTNSSFNATNVKDETSGDDESEESEEE